MLEYRSYGYLLAIRTRSGDDRPNLGSVESAQTCDEPKLRNRHFWALPPNLWARFFEIGPLGRAIPAKAVAAVRQFPPAIWCISPGGTACLATRLERSEGRSTELSLGLATLPR